MLSQINFYFITCIILTELIDLVIFLTIDLWMGVDSEPMLSSSETGDQASQWSGLFVAADARRRHVSWVSSSGSIH